jgi:putative CocE/NonD family hydrolase
MKTAGRPDVLTFETEPLTTPLHLAGRPLVNLYASTSGTDSDWAVKLIDVYPGTYPYDPPMGGYELPIATDIFRGRYRTSFGHPEAIAPNQPLLYNFGLPMVNHVFEPGHRIMVQVQSTLFPLYDRNPQTYVPNIFDAKPADYQKATQRIWHGPEGASFISLPVVTTE